MVAIPMMLEDALRMSGYTIDAFEFAGAEISVGGGSIVVPPMVLSKLTWHRDSEPPLNAAFYLDRIPAFHEAYKPVQLSLALDRFRRRRLGYDTVDEFALAVRRWSTVNMGALSVLRRRWLSVATPLPLDDMDVQREASEHGESEKNAQATGQSTVNSSDTSTDTVSSSDQSNTTSTGRDAASDFPDGQLAGDLNYASGVMDRVAEGTVAGTGSTSAERSGSGLSTVADSKTDTASASDDRTSTGRDHGRNRSVMELLELQRSAYLNVDEEYVSLMESLFLGVFDQPEKENSIFGLPW